MCSPDARFFINETKKTNTRSSSFCKCSPHTIPIHNKFYAWLSLEWENERERTSVRTNSIWVYARVWMLMCEPCVCRGRTVARSFVRLLAYLFGSHLLTVNRVYVLNTLFCWGLVHTPLAKRKFTLGSTNFAIQQYYTQTPYTAAILQLAQELDFSFRIEKIWISIMISIDHVFIATVNELDYQNRNARGTKDIWRFTD